MGYLRYLWDLTVDADDPVNGYTAYEFVPVNMSLSRDFARRESIAVIPGMDGVLDGYGRDGGPMDRRDLAFTFHVFTPDGNLDKAYDLLAAQVAPGVQQRLVYQTDAGGLRFTVGSNPRIQHTLTSTSNWGGGGVCVFTVTWRIRPDWRLRQSESVELFASVQPVFRSDNSEVFGNKGVTAITLVQQPFTVDARGTAGIDLPTLPDRGPLITLNGPMGGDGGILIANSSVLITDGNGVRQPMQFTLPFKLPTSADSCRLDFATQQFTADGLVIRPSKPAYQREYFRIAPGILNQCIVDAVGTNQLTGGQLFVDWWRRFI